MKKITSLLLLSLIIVTGCASSLMKQREEITIEYQAMTRGSNREVIVNHNSVETRSIAGPKASATATVTKEQWDDVLKELDKVSLDNISELKSPTNKRMYDGALIATLTVKMKDTTYRSSSFDHGEPPAEIAALVNKIVSMSALDKERE